MLLVDADQPDARKRREDRGTRSDDHGRGSARDPLALVPSLSIGEARVEDGHAVAEAGAETSERLRRERDLGDEDDRALPALDRHAAGLEVDLRLPASGRAVEEEVTAARFGSRGDPRQRFLLRSAQFTRRRLAAERVVETRTAELTAARRLGRRDQRQCSRRRRAVVVGRPERQVDEPRRQLVKELPGRDRLDPCGRRVL